MFMQGCISGTHLYSCNMKQAVQIEKNIVRNGIRTHAHIRGPDLKSGALDRSATLTVHG